MLDRNDETRFRSSYGRAAVSEYKPGDVVAIRAEVIATGGRVFSDDDPRAPLNGRIWVVVGGARSSVLRGDIAPWPDAVRLEALVSSRTGVRFPAEAPSEGVA